MTAIGGVDDHVQLEEDPEILSKHSFLNESFSNQRDYTKRKHFILRIED